MDALSVFFLVAATAAVCVFLMQVYAIYENFHHIQEFNEEYSGLEYARSVGGGSYVDRKVQDPNDDESDVRAKWRCVLYERSYVTVSKFGFGTVRGREVRKFADLDECVEFNYLNGDLSNVWNPCIDSAEGLNSSACSFLKSVL
ncbi:IMV MP/virus entry [Western grey kangaroopox virus]|uniref:IMV MP/virus entry n=1 Tax=Western grey kangaroopox virus TaxID=1566307 RepID=A0A2C9DST4_9POXV|nr:IMV MP/virus entry [Western grey kangaroopox virus]ATI21067.1 IMV MP/virus entry [Western grey kangaroopox virus]